MNFPLPIQSETHLIDKEDFEKSFRHYLEASKLNSEQDELVKKIFKEIDSGTTSTVYSFKYGGKTFAVKHYKQEYLEKKRRTRMRDQAVSLALPDHPNLVKTFFTTDEFSVMEFVPGGNLFTSLDEHSREEKNIRCQLLKIVRGIQTLHEKGIVHRDIKHENILFNPETQVLKIADFGLARFLKTPDGNPPTSDMHLKQRKLSISGTPRYVAPEIVRFLSQKTNPEEYSFPVDIWSLGVIAYEMITNKRLFSFDDTVSHHYKFLRSDEKVEIPKDLPPLWQDLLGCMLEKDPAKRISLDQILKHPLFAND